MSDNNISDDIIAGCATNAAFKTEGVAGMVGGFTNALSKNIFGKELLSKGVKVNQRDDGTVDIDVAVNVLYGCHVPSVAWDIQENVKKEVEEMTDLTVTAVNISIHGVKMDKAETKSEDKSDEKPEEKPDVKSGKEENSNDQK